jgi:hypothetical protein
LCLLLRLYNCLFYFACIIMATFSVCLFIILIYKLQYIAWQDINTLYMVRVRIVRFNVTFNNTSVISWQWIFIGGGNLSTRRKLAERLLNMLCLLLRLYNCLFYFACIIMATFSVCLFIILIYKLHYIILWLVLSCRYSFKQLQTQALMSYSNRLHWKKIHFIIMHNTLI